VLAIVFIADVVFIADPSKEFVADLARFREVIGWPRLKIRPTPDQLASMTVLLS